MSEMDFAKDAVTVDRSSCVFVPIWVSYLWFCKFVLYLCLWRKTRCLCVLWVLNKTCKVSMNFQVTDFMYVLKYKISYSVFRNAYTDHRCSMVWVIKISYSLVHYKIYFSRSTFDNRDTIFSVSSLSVVIKGSFQFYSITYHV